MATEKIGIYRRWLESTPIEKGVKIPKDRWTQERRHCWEVRWYGTNGKRYSKNFKTKKLAEQFLRKLQEEVNKGKADKPSKIYLKDFIIEHEKLMQGQISYATLVVHMRALRFFEKFIGKNIYLTNILPKHAEEYIADRLSSGSSTATVNKDIRTLRRVFNLAIEPRGYLKEGLNPFAKIKKRKRTEKTVKYLTIEDYHKLLDSTNKLWWKTFISIAYCCGLRRNEILNLTWADIDFENQYLHITPKHATKFTFEWEPKGHESRVVPMPDETTQFLVDLQVDAPTKCPYIFISPKRLSLILDRIKKGKWNSTSDIINNLLTNYKILCSKAKIGNYSIHDLRRSAITNWAQKLQIQVVKQLAGHSDISTTMKFYLSVRPENMESASKAINMMLEEAKKQLTQK